MNTDSTPYPYYYPATSQSCMYAFWFVCRNSHPPATDCPRCHIQIDDRIFIQMLLEQKVLNHHQIGKQAARVARAIVISVEHPRRHRLLETVTARHTTEPLLRPTSR